ncbi:MAG: PfkB family carbohydrate kinase [Caldilineaceae bacterium]
MIFAVDHHPRRTRKARASAFINCGGGTTANTAMTAAMLGYRTAFAGHLGRDIYGDEHLAEFHGRCGYRAGGRGRRRRPSQRSFVKPNGDRSIVSYKGDTDGLTPADVDFRAVQAKVLPLRRPPAQPGPCPWQSGHVSRASPPCSRRGHGERRDSAPIGPPVRRGGASEQFAQSSQRPRRRPAWSRWPSARPA